MAQSRSDSSRADTLTPIAVEFGTRDLPSSLQESLHPWYLAIGVGRASTVGWIDQTPYGRAGTASSFHQIGCEIIP